MSESFARLIPGCCGKRMQVRFENSKYMEMICMECDDLVLIRK
jgi:hypothetical protein